jgi:hypothetical protein
VQPNRKRATIALLLFGVSFGYVEAAAANYLGGCMRLCARVFSRIEPRVTYSHSLR